MRISKVVTKTGDQGATALIGGQRVSKGSLRVAAYGEVDELNSVLGLAAAHLQDPQCRDMVHELQHLLFTLGADLASPEGVEVPRVSEQHVEQLEQLLDGLMDELPPLEEFILPGGGPGGATLHVARTVARRAERTVVALQQETSLNPQAIIFLNRLSDLLFVMARVANRREGLPETLADFSRRKKRPQSHSSNPE
jgi:cob(I)alamin adenosyltransferase